MIIPAHTHVYPYSMLQYVYYILFMRSTLINHSNIFKKNRLFEVLLKDEMNLNQTSAEPGHVVNKSVDRRAYREVNVMKSRKK